MATFIQSVDTSTTGAESSSVTSPTFASNRTAGRMLWFVVTYSATTARSITYSGCLTGAVERGDYYNSTDGIGFRWGYVANISGGSTSAGVATFSGNSQVSYHGIYIAEYSGIATSSPATGTSVIQRQAAPGQGSNAITSGNITPGSQPGILLGFTFNFDDIAPSGGTNFVSRPTVWGFGFGAHALPEYKLFTATSAIAATATATFSGSGTMTYYTLADAYLDSGSGGGSVGVTGMQKAMAVGSAGNSRKVYV